MGARIRQSALQGYFEQLHELAVARLPLSDLAQALAEIRRVTPGSDTATRLGRARRGHAPLFRQMPVAV